MSLAYGNDYEDKRLDYRRDDIGGGKNCEDSQESLEELHRDPSTSGCYPGLPPGDPERAAASNLASNRASGGPRAPSPWHRSDSPRRCKDVHRVIELVASLTEVLGTVGMLIQERISLRPEARTAEWDHRRPLVGNILTFTALAAIIVACQAWLRTVKGRRA